MASLRFGQDIFGFQVRDLCTALDDGKMLTGNPYI
jgi:hypothetical protein